MEKPSQQKLLILADDLTGALDSGVQLVRRGQKVVILLKSESLKSLPLDEFNVVVVDTESRHLDAKDAYQIVYENCKNALGQGITSIYKKTDSGLRGNVGSELQAVLDAASSDYLHFIPAYPDLDRKTINGIHYVNGIPVGESIFAKDPIDPVIVSKVDEIIHLQSAIPVCYNQKNKEKCIVVHNASTTAELRDIAKKLKEENELFLTAGCAGFLEVFPLEKETSDTSELSKLKDKLVILSGSVNQVTEEQLNYAETHGAIRYHIPIEELLSNKVDIKFIEKEIVQLLNDSNSNFVLIDTIHSYKEMNDKYGNCEIAKTIQEYLGEIATTIHKYANDYTFMIIGGDTLTGYIQKQNVSSLIPEKEIYPGIVLASYGKEEKNYLITKSGGFGNENLLTEILEWLK